MATPNSDPIFTRVGHVEGVPISAANTSSAGGGTIGTDIFLAFTADATNGSYVDWLRFMPTASVANTSTTATVLRVFKSSKTTGTTAAADTHLIAEVITVSVVADGSTNMNNAIDVSLQLALAPGDSILVTSHAAPAASTAWKAVVVGGDY